MTLAQQRAERQTEPLRTSPPLAPPPQLRRRGVGSATAVLLPLAVPVALLIGWVAGTASGAIPQRIFPSPTQVWDTMVRLVSDGTLLEDATISLTRALLGFALGAGAAIALGLLTGLSERGRAGLDPVLQAFRAIPGLALISLFVLWFGFSELSKILLIAVAVFGPVYVNTLSGILQVDRRLTEVAHVYRFSTRERVLGVIVPQALPALFSGLRISATVSLIVLVAVEQAGTTTGLGWRIFQGQQYFDSGQVIFMILVYTLVGLALDFAIRGVQWLALPWTRRSASR